MTRVQRTNQILPSKAAEAAESEEKEMLTLADVGRMVGRTAQTVGRWCNDGLLNCRRLPSGLRVVPRSEVEKFIGGSALATTKGGG